jgi:HK97 family phage major capsid protein
MKSSTQKFEMTADEHQRYDLCGLLRAQIAPELYRAEFENDISDRLHRAGAVASHADRGIAVPLTSLARSLTATRDLVVGTPTAGGNLVATDLASGVIELLRPATRVIEAGATVLTGCRGNVAISRVTATSTVQWVAENTAPSESQPAFDQIVLTPKMASAFVDISRRLILQTDGNRSAQQLVESDLRNAIGVALDSAAINGSGTSNQPRGVINTAGIGSVAGGANGAVPTFDNVVDLEASVAHANTIEQRMAFLTNTRVRARLQRSQMFSGTNGIPIWQRSDAGEDRLNGRRAFVSNNVPNTLTKGTSNGVCSAILYGNWSDLIIALWGEGVSLIVDPYSGSTAGTVRVVVLLDADVAVRYPTSFSSMLDALTS